MTTTTNAAARFLHTLNLLDMVEGNTPAGYAIRALLTGLDLAAVRAEVTAALDLPLPEQAAPAAEAAPASAVDAETVAALVREQVAALVREQVAAHITALDLRQLASESAAAAFKAADLDYEGIITNSCDLRRIVKDAVFDSGLDFDDIARDVITDAVSSAVDFDDIARDVVQDRVNKDLSVDADELAREIVEEKIDNDFNVDVDDLAREIVEEKIANDLDLDSAVGAALSGMSVTVTLK